MKLCGCRWGRAQQRPCETCAEKRGCGLGRSQTSGMKWIGDKRMMDGGDELGGGCYESLSILARLELYLTSTPRVCRSGRCMPVSEGRVSSCPSIGRLGESGTNDPGRACISRTRTCPSRPRNNNRCPSSLEAVEVRRKVLGAGSRALREPGVMTDINARRGYPIGRPPRVRLCQCARWQYNTVLSIPRVITVGDGDGGIGAPPSPSSVDMWQGLWICPVKVMDQGSWPVVAAWWSVHQRLLFLGREVNVSFLTGQEGAQKNIDAGLVGRSVGRTVVRAGPGPGPLMTPPSFFVIVLFPWSRAREPVSDITGVRSQRVGLCLCPCKRCGKSLRVSTSGGGGRGSGMRDRGSESRWCRGGARAASGWWVGPNGKNSRSNLGGVCVWEGGVSVRAPDVDELVRTAGCREARERRRGRERGFPEKGWASDAPPLLAPSVRSAWVCGPGIGYTR